MPIKDPTIYPPYWKQFSLYIRKERAGDKCEQCGVGNGEIVARGTIPYADYDRPFWFDDHTGEVHCAWTGEVLGRCHDYELDITRETFIVLTVAHLDHPGGICRCKEQTGRKCARPDHVLALCQACHLRLDLPARQLAAAVRNDARRTLFAEVPA